MALTLGTFKSLLLLHETPANSQQAPAAGLQFHTTGTKYIYAQWEVPDDWAGDNVIIEIDWYPDGADIPPGAAIRWVFEYRAIAEGELITQGTVATVDNGIGGDTTGYVRYKTKHTQFVLPYNHASQPLTKQDHLFFRVWRDAPVAGDFGGTVVATEFEVIYHSVGIPTSN